MKLKFRYIVATLVVVISIVVTPFCIEAAYQARGYQVFGGEYLLIPFGVLIAIVILMIAKEWDGYLSALKAKNRMKQESEE